MAFKGPRHRRAANNPIRGTKREKIFQSAEPSRPKYNVVLDQPYIVVAELKQSREAKTNGALGCPRYAIIHFDQFCVLKLVIPGERGNTGLRAAVVPDQIETAFGVKILQCL